MFIYYIFNLPATAEICTYIHTISLRDTLPISISSIRLLGSTPIFCYDQLGWMHIGWIVAIYYLAFLLPKPLPRLTAAFVTVLDRPGKRISAVAGNILVLEA